MILPQHWLAGIVGLALISLTLPGTIELGLLTFAGILPRSAKRPNRSKLPLKKLAIVVPAHNEAKLIGRCIASLKKSEFPEATDTVILVVADNCSDQTADLARAAGARVLERVDPERRGKGYALQFAFSRLLAEGFDAVFVVDADSVVDANSISEVVSLLEAGADGVQTRYLVLNYELSMRTRLMHVAFLAFNLLRPRGRERLGLSVGIFGNGFALSRATLEAVPFQAHSVVEDLEYHLQLVRAGRRVVLAEGAAVRADAPVDGAAARTQRGRWEGGRLRAVADNVPGLVRGLFAGNWLLAEPLLELLLFPLALQVALFAVLLVLPFAAASIYAWAGLGLVVMHVCAGIVVGGGDLKDFAALAAAPLYIAWKLTAVPAILKAASDSAGWIRTPRH